MHHHAIIVAGTQREAEQWAEAVFHGLITHQGVRAQHFRTSGQYQVFDPETGQLVVVDYTSAPNAVRNLRGRLPDEIIIAGDYLRWFLARGSMHALWQIVRMTQARSGAVVSWW